MHVWDHMTDKPNYSLKSFPCMPASGSATRLLAAVLLKVRKQFVGICEARTARMGNFVRFCHRRSGFGVGDFQLPRECLVGNQASVKQMHGVRRGKAYRIQNGGALRFGFVVQSDV